MPQSILIVGNGLSAWMTAATLLRTVNPADYSVSIMAADNDDTMPGTADAIMPTPAPLHAALSLDENQFVANDRGSFTLGSALGGWSDPGSTYFSPYSSIGASIGPLSFFQAVMRLRQSGSRIKLANYSLAALAAQAGRFDRPSPNTRSVLSTLDCGLHIDLAALTDHYRRAATAMNVTQLSAGVRDVERQSDDRLQAVVTTDGERYEPDWFIDCSGAQRRLFAEAGNRDWQSWSDWSHCDRAVSTTMATTATPSLFSYAAAHPAGWIRQLPLNQSISLTSFYCSDYMGDDAAIANLHDAIEDSRQSTCEITPLSFGQLQQPWRGNCIALGSAAALIDPIGISNLQLLRTSLSRLLALLPSSSEATVEAQEFNRQTRLHNEHARDFAIAHYQLNGRNGEPFWDRCRAMPLPDSLQYRQSLYESRGRLVQYDEEPLDDFAWINLFDEQGVQARSYTPVADSLELSELENHLARVRQVMVKELGNMPTHADYLATLHRNK